MTSRFSPKTQLSFICLNLSAEGENVFWNYSFYLKNITLYDGGGRKSIFDYEILQGGGSPKSRILYDVI